VLKTRVSDLLGVEHPVLLGGMSTHTTPEMVAGVSNAGGLGILGCAGMSPQAVARNAEEICALSDRPFGMNLLLFMANDEAVSAVLAASPSVFSTAWGFPQTDLAALFSRAHEAGAKVSHMASTVAEAERAVEAGADIIVAQGTEGGGHVGVMGTMPLVPMVVRAADPVPVVAAGGVSDGAGLAAALALGAEGVLLGTRFLASPESPLSADKKQAILDSDGHNTALTEIPDLISGRVWPGAYARTTRNRLIEDWMGREGELRYRRAEVAALVQEAHQAGDADNSVMYTGQTAGLINDIQPVSAIVQNIVAEAEAILRQRLPRMLAS
jgi:NAD(P)H-dependent flavin oxidoreductase YrpB (nitropropane dioxygenase family)